MPHAKNDPPWVPITATLRTIAPKAELPALVPCVTGRRKRPTEPRIHAEDD